MKMSTPLAPFRRVTADERAAVERALRQGALPPRQRERLEMVKAAMSGQDVAWIARWTGRSPARIRHWLATFQAGGVGALADAPRAGRPAKADAAYLTALEAAVTTSPRALGLPVDVWTSARLSAYLAEQTGTVVSPGWLRVRLRQRRFACGRPTHTLTHLHDPAEVATCAERLRVAGEKGGRRARSV
jgi:transposase